MVYPPTGSTAKDREMSTHAYAPSGRGTIYLTPSPLSAGEHSEPYRKLPLTQNLDSLCHTMLAYFLVQKILGRFLKLQDHK